MYLVAITIEEGYLYLQLSCYGFIYFSIYYFTIISYYLCRTFCLSFTLTIVVSSFWFYEQRIVLVVYKKLNDKQK